MPSGLVFFLSLFFFSVFLLFIEGVVRRDKWQREESARQNEGGAEHMYMARQGQTRQETAPDVDGNGA